MKEFGYTIIGYFIFCFFGGYYLDQKFKTGYVFSLSGMGLACALTGYEIWKISKKDLK